MSGNVVTQKGVDDCDNDSLRRDRDCDNVNNHYCGIITAEK